MIMFPVYPVLNVGKSIIFNKPHFQQQFSCNFYRGKVKVFILLIFVDISFRFNFKMIFKDFNTFNLTYSAPLFRL